MGFLSLSRSHSLRSKAITSLPLNGFAATPTVYVERVFGAIFIYTRTQSDYVAYVVDGWSVVDGDDDDDDKREKEKKMREDKSISESHVIS